MNTKIPFADFETDIEDMARRLASNPDAIQGLTKIIRLAKLGDDDTKLMRGAVPYLSGVSLTLKMAFINGRDNVKDWIVSPEFEKIILAYVWGKVKHLRPELNEEEGIALIKELSDRCGEVYYGVEQKKKSDGGENAEYRTKRKAGAIAHLPDVIANISFPGFEYGVSMLADGNAHLELLDTVTADRLQFKDGLLYFEDDSGGRQEFTEAHLRKAATKEGIDKINLTLLRYYYSVILKGFEGKIKEFQQGKIADEESLRKELTFMPVTFYLPDLLRELTGGGYATAGHQIDKVINETWAFRNIIGVISDYYGEKRRESYYPVLNFRGYDSKTNTISFESPYLSYLALKLHESAIKRNKSGRVIRTRRGVPAMHPRHSYLVLPSIDLARNKDAALTAMNIATLIEQAGGTEAHINAAELIRRNPVFEARLKESTNKRQLLSRHFKSAYKLLNEHTKLKEVYGLIFDANADTIPVESNLESLTLTFKHKRKKGAADEEDTQKTVKSNKVNNSQDIGK